ncbi:MAG: hypothetical protein QE278_13685 [Limnobacter sp.]|nr:hypothetical protein [Limnobacter sp.]
MNINSNTSQAQHASAPQLLSDFAASTRQRWSSFSLCVSGLFKQLHVQCPMCLSVQVEEDGPSPFDPICSLNPELGVPRRPLADINADAYVNFWLTQSPGRLSDNDVYATRKYMHEYFQQNYGDEQLSATEIEALYKSSVEQRSPSDSTESIQSEPEVAEAGQGLSPKALEILKTQLKGKGLEPVVLDKQRHVVSELKQLFSPRSPR